MSEEPYVLYAEDFLNHSPHEPKFKPQNPDELALLEFRTEEMTGSGLILLPTTTLKPGQLNIVPKWRVIAVGDNVEKELGVIAGDLVIVSRYTGRMAYLDQAEFRMVNYRDILAKVKMEPWKDFKGLFERIQHDTESKDGKERSDFYVAE